MEKDRLKRGITMIGAPSNIGIRPYDGGELRGIDEAPSVLRQLGLGRRIEAADAGDVVPPAYRDRVRVPGQARNEAEVGAYSRVLAQRVAAVLGEDRFALVLGGDCSIVLGCLLGARGGTGAGIGLAYIDGHADFATPAESTTGSVASMCLGLAVGRGETPLARLESGSPLVRPEDVALVGRRDAAESWYGHDALGRSAILDIPDAAIREGGYQETAAAVLDRVARAELDGFWIHVDADVLDPAVVPAVDSPEPGGPDLDDLVELLTPLVRHPNAVGMELTIYDPKLDPERISGQRLVDLLSRALLA